MIIEQRLVTKTDARVAQAAAKEAGADFNVLARPGQVWNGQKVRRLQRAISIEYPNEAALANFDHRSRQIEQSLSGPIPAIGGIAIVLVNLFAKI